MTRDHEVVGARAAVPVRVLVRHDVDIVGDDADEAVTGISGDGQVDVVDDEGHAHRHEESVGLIRAPGQEWAVAELELVDELALNAIDVLQGTGVKQRPLPLPVDPYLEPLHHLYVTPASIHTHIHIHPYILYIYIYMVDEFKE